MVLDALIVGSGPAALSLAAACGERGLRTAVVGGADVAWSNNFGLWADDLSAVGMSQFVGTSWDSTQVVLRGRRTALDRAYVRLARRRLRTHLLERCDAHGVILRWERAVAVEHESGSSTIFDASGGSLQARMVVDASGHEPAFVQRARRASTFQAAFGWVICVEEHPWDPDVATFMDWTPADDMALRDGPPTFLYAMPLSRQRVLVEETSLVHGPAVPYALLRDRLRRRLARMGVQVREVESTELCLIPMDPSLPDLTQRVVGFGAAASFVHPATGYQLARSLRGVDRLVGVLADGLGAGTEPQRLAREAWSELWPGHARLQRRLFLYGSRLLAGLDHEDMVSFFEAFFQLGPTARREYLAGDGGTGAVVGAMGALFARCSPRLQARIAWSGVVSPRTGASRWWPGRDGAGGVG